VQVIILEEFTKLFISTFAHLIQLFFLPRVQVHAAHIALLHSHTPMYASAMHAQEDAIIYTSPLWICQRAIKAMVILLL